MENTIIPFTMKIKQYHQDGTYLVEYLPDDADCYPIEYAIQISLDDTDASTEESIMRRLAGCSPQHFWNIQKLQKTFDSSMRESLVGAIQENAHEMLPPTIDPLSISTGGTLTMPEANTIPTQIV
jgi:hypothetical protein